MIFHCFYNFFSVDRQGELLDQIEIAVTGAEEHIEKGTVHLKGALKARKSSRKRMFIILLIIVIIIVVIVLAVLLK